MSLVGKNAIVTGGASGIGLATCRRLAREGVGIGVWDIDYAGAQRAAAELVAAGARAVACNVDVSARAQICRRSGARSRRARPGADPRQQRRHDLFQAVSRGHGSRMGQDHVRESEEHVPVHAGRTARHARGGLGTRHQHILVERTDGQCTHDHLRLVQGRGDRIHQVAGARARGDGDHRQQHSAGIRGYADAAGEHREHRRRYRRPGGKLADEETGTSGGHRGGLRVPGVGGGRLYHGPHVERQRRDRHAHEHEEHRSGSSSPERRASWARRLRARFWRRAQSLRSSIALAASQDPAQGHG